VPGITSYVLRGGPCAGKTGSLTPGIIAAGEVDCQGGQYKITHPVQVVNGREVFKYAGKVPAPPKATVTAPRAHKGWSDMQRSVNHHWPAAMRRSEHHLRAAWRSLGKARKVHH
jgi:hypothetical protein